MASLCRFLFACALIVLAAAKGDAFAANVDWSEINQLIHRINADIPPDQNGNPGKRKPGPLPTANAPDLLAISGGKVGTLGAFTEIIPDSGVYVAARHVLQGLNDTFPVQMAFIGVDRSLADYEFFEFRNPLSEDELPADAIIAIPKKKLLKFLIENRSDGRCEGESPRFTLRINKLIQATVNHGDAYYSYQYGSVGGHAVSQFSHGAVAHIADHRFFLELGGNNRSNPRSSGSVVFTLRDDQTQWRAAGIIECIVPQKTTKLGLVIPGGARVIPFYELMSHELRPISLEKLVKEPFKNDDPSCIKIGGRDAGD